MNCTIKYNTDNSVNDVLAPNGEKSQLFQALNESVLIGSKTTAWNVQKNVYSNKIKDLYNDVKDPNYVYSTNEPKLFYKKGQTITDNLETAILSNPGLDNMEMGFKNPKTDSFIKIASVSDINNSNSIQGYVIDQVKKGQLSATKVLEGNEFVYQGKGAVLSTRVINANLAIDDITLLVDGKEPMVSVDGTFSITSNKDLHIVSRNGETEVIHTDNIEEALKDPTVDNKLELKLAQAAANGFGLNKNETAVKTPAKTTKQLTTALTGFLNRMGFTTRTLEAYAKDHNARMGEDPTIQALVDISKKVVAFAEGQDTVDNLSEEVAHIAIEMYNDQESITSLLGEVINHPEYNEFAEIYRAKYSENHSGIELEDMVRREILGKILKNKMQDNFSTQNATEVQLSLFQKLAKLFSDFLNNIRNNYRGHSRKNFDKILNDVINSVTEQEISKFTNDSLTSEDRIFFSIATEEAKTFRFKLQELYESLNANRRAQEKSKLNIDNLKSLETDTSLADQLNIANSLLGIIGGETKSALAALEALDPKKGEVLNNTDRVVAQSSIKMKDTLSDVLEGLNNLKGLNPDLTSKFNTLITITENLQKEVSKLATKMVKDEDNFVTNLMTDLIEGLDESEETILKLKGELGSTMKDIGLMARIFGLPSNSRNIYMNALVRKARDINSEANSRLLERANPFVGKYSGDKYVKLQSKIVKGDTSHLLHHVDMDAFEKARVKNEVDTIVKLTGVSQEVAEKARNEYQVEELVKMTEDLYEEYLESNREWIRNNTEQRFGEEYIKATEERYELTKLNPATKTLLKIKSARTREVTSKAYNKDGRRDISLLNESDFNRLNNINQQHKQDKSAVDIDGSIKQGVKVKKASELTAAERQEFDFLGDKFLDSLGDRTVIVLDKSVPVMSEEAIIAADLQKLDLYTSKQIEEKGTKFFSFDAALLEELEKIEKAGGSSYKWAVKNGNIAYAEELFDELKTNTPYIKSLEDYINNLPTDERNKALPLLAEYKEQLMIKQNLLKQNRLTGSPVEIDYDNMPIETREALRKLDVSISSLSRSLSLPEELRTESGVDFETDLSQQFYDLAKDSGKTQVEFAEEHMTKDKSDILGTYRHELKQSLAKNIPSSNSSLNNFIMRLSDEKRLDEDKVEEYAITNKLSSEEALVDFVLLEYCKENVYSYFKKSAPKGYNELITRLDDGDITMTDFIKNKDEVQKEYPNLPLNYIQYNPGFSWRDGALEDNILNPNFDVNGGAIQPKLSIYADNVYFDTYGINKTEWLKNPTFDLKEVNATKNKDQFDLLTGTVEMHRAIIENYNDTGTVSPFLRQQIRRHDAEKKLSYFKKDGKIASLKDSLTDIITTKRDEMSYGTEIESRSLTDAKGNPIVSSIRTIPKYFQTLLNEPLTENVIGAAVIGLKQSEIYKSRKEKVTEMEAIVNYISRQQHAESGSGVAKRIFNTGEASNTSLMAKEFINHAVYGVKDNYKVLSSLKINGEPVDVTAAVRNVTGYIRTLNLKYNPVVDATSATTGSLFTRIEAKVGEHFSEDSFVKARKTWWTLIGQYVNESGKVHKESLMNKILEKFSVESIEGRVTDSQYGRPIRLLEKGGFAMSKAGNLPVTSRVLLAALFDYRIYNGKLITHKQFLEVKKAERKLTSQSYDRKALNTEWKALGDNSMFSMLDLESPSITYNQKFVDYIAAKYPEASAETLEEIMPKVFTEFVNKVTAKATTVISRVDGVMNEVDQVMLQRHFLGSLTTLHKGWLFLNLGNRFKDRHVSFMNNKIEEGHYRSFIRTGKRFFQELKKAQGNPVAAYDKLKEEGTYEEYKNFKRVLMETALVGIMYMIGAAVMADDDDDDGYLATASKLLYMRTFGEYNSTQAVGLPGLTFDQLKNPVVIQTQLEALYKGGLNLASGEGDKAIKQARKLTLVTKRYDKLYGTESLKAYYNQYLHFNSENLLGLH